MHEDKSTILINVKSDKVGKYALQTAVKLPEFINQII
jgi:hypothetical protein